MPIGFDARRPGTVLALDLREPSRRLLFPAAAELTERDLRDSPSACSFDSAARWTWPRAGRVLEALWGAAPYDLILMDRQMPVVDG